MSTDLSLNDQNTTLSTLVENPYEADPTVFSSVAGGGFLPIIQLQTTGDAVKDGKVEMNKYAIRRGKDDYIQMGKEVDVIFIQWRPRAMNISDKTNMKISYNPKSELWKDIKNIADSKTPNNGCMYGPEYLIYIPDHDMLATFYMGGTSARNESRNTHSLFSSREGKFLGGQGTLKSRQLQNAAGQKWQSPFVTICSTPLNQPDPERVREVLEDFLHPVEVTGMNLEKATNVQVVER